MASDDIKLGVNYSEVKGATKAVHGLGNSLRSTSVQQSGLTKKSKKFTMGIQQAGFQVGDFAAQVQNGTSAMVALGQQGPQLLGVLGVWGALAGAALAIGTAIIKAKNAGKELKFDFKGIGTDLGKLFEPAKPFFDQIGKAFKWVGGIFMSFINGAIVALAKWYTILGHAPAIFKEAFSKAGLYVDALKLRIEIFSAKSNIAVNEFLLNFKKGSKNTLDTIRRYFGGFGNAAKKVMSLAGEAIKTVFENLKTNVGNIFKSLINTVIEQVNWMIEKVNVVNAASGGMFDPMEAIETMTLTPTSDAALKSAQQMGQEIRDAYYKGFNEAITTTVGVGDPLEQQIINRAKDGLMAAADDLSMLQLELDKPLASVQDLYAALEKVGSFDLGKYFSWGAKQAKKNLKDVKSNAEKARDALSSAMETAFMSLVEGTKSVKDAFRDMASAVIKELYRIYVVQKITGMITGALKGSDVPLFGGKANGGPVGAGGSYLVGERGPEIFTPSTSGTITPNSKSGGAGSGVTVVQNINISTGVQQTVRAEIRQMMPQIAQSAKSAVVDSKRRGGNYGRAMA
jgi:hypothetical protein